MEIMTKYIIIFCVFYFMISHFFYFQFWFLCFYLFCSTNCVSFTLFEFFFGLCVHVDIMIIRLDFLKLILPGHTYTFIFVDFCCFKSLTFWSSTLCQFVSFILNFGFWKRLNLLAFTVNLGFWTSNVWKLRLVLFFYDTNQPKRAR